MSELNADELDLLEWLSREDFSQYGECHGKALDRLVALGLAEVMGPETERQNTFIAKGDGIMFRAVRLTRAGIERANQADMGKRWEAAMNAPGVSIPVGPIVLCDNCNADWTDREESGGFLFMSKAICPDCAPDYLKSVKRYKEEEYIRGECPPDQSFADWVRGLRGPDSAITVTTGPLR